MIIDYELFKQQVVIPDEKLLLKTLNRVFNKMGGKGQLKVVPISLFPDNPSADPTSAPEIVDNKTNVPEAVTQMV